MAKKLNVVISTLIVSDALLFFALGLLSPIFGIFILENIEGSTLAAIGTASAVYWIARVTSVLPISKLLDVLKGEKDEYYAVIIGTFGLAILPLFYIVATDVTHIYIIEFFKGLAGALAVPAWRILFTKFVDRKLVGLGWSLEDVCVGVATASSAYIGAMIAEHFGFRILFIMVSIMGSIAAIFLTRLYKEKRIRESQPEIINFIQEKISVTTAPLKIDEIK
jgi:MFS family permease